MKTEKDKTIELLEEEITLLKEQNRILTKNTWITGVFGFLAIIIAMFAVLK